MRTNTSTKRAPIQTHEGGRAAHITPVQQLRRSVLSCLLHEREFYESGVAIADRIRDAAQQVPVSVLAALAIEARSRFHLRHIPLYLTALLAQRARGTSLVSETLPQVIQRADEMAEFLAVYAQVNGVTPDKIKPKLSNQVRKGLAAAIHNFGWYHLARYARDHAVKMADVVFLAHPKPRNAEEKLAWENVLPRESEAMKAAGTLMVPDDWERALSGGADKKEAFTRLLEERKLGYLATLRNLRNMQQAGVDVDLVNNAILARRGAERVLPFRYVAAARAAPQFEPALDHALCAAISQLPALSGRTAVLADVSSSMDDRLSAKSDMTRADAAATLASMINADSLRVFSFSNRVVEVPPRRGMAGVDAILRSQVHNGTALFDAVHWVNTNVPHDRLIVITDEQSNAPGVFGYRVQGTLRGMPEPVCENAYVINVASSQNGVGYGRWTHIDGMSEQVLTWIVEYEADILQEAV